MSLFIKERENIHSSQIVTVGITMSSVIAKTLEIVLLNKRMSPILDEIGFPDMNQTAFQKGISCSDAIFSTQEVLVNYICQGTSYAYNYDIEKTFDSVEFPILLSHLLFVGHQWKKHGILSNHGTAIQPVL